MTRLDRLAHAFTDALAWWMTPGLLSMPPATMLLIGMGVILLIYCCAAMAG